MKSEENGRSPGQTPLLRPGQTPGQTPLSSSTLEPPRPERARQLGTADIPARGCDHALRALQPTKPDGGSLPPSPLPWNPVIKSFGRISLSLSLFFSFSFFFLQITIIISCFFFLFWRIEFESSSCYCADDVGKSLGNAKKKKNQKMSRIWKGGKWIHRQLRLIIFAGAKNRKSHRELRQLLCWFVSKHGKGTRVRFDLFILSSETLSSAHLQNWNN